MTEQKREVLWMVEEMPSENGEIRSFWTKVGTASENRDGSYTLELKAFPRSGKIQMRDAKP